MQKKGIALLITLLFVMLITLGVGTALKQIKDTSNDVQKQNFLFQTTMILKDVQIMLQENKDLEYITKENSVSALNLFLTTASFIPFEAAGIKVIIELKSAREKFNPNVLKDNNETKQQIKSDLFQRFLDEKNVNNEYVTLLLDNMSKIRQDGAYRSDIFNQNPLLFRDYIASLEHLEQINNFYNKKYHEDINKKVDFSKLFYFKKMPYNLDLNYISSDIWQIILGCDKQRGDLLAQNSGGYEKMEDLDLSEDEIYNLSFFPHSFFEPILAVKLTVIKDNLEAKIEFEYDLKTKKGTNFIYEI